MTQIILLDFKEKWRTAFFLPIVSFVILLIFKITNFFIHFPIKHLYTTLDGLNSNFLSFIGLNKDFAENDFSGVWIIYITFFSIIYMIHACNFIKKLLGEDESSTLLIYQSDVVKSPLKLFFSKISVAFLLYLLEFVLFIVLSFIVIAINDADSLNFKTFYNIFKTYSFTILISLFFFTIGLFHETRINTFLDYFSYSIIIVLLNIVIGKICPFIKLFQEYAKNNDIILPVKITHFFNIILSKSLIFKYISPISWCGYENEPSFKLIPAYIVFSIALISLSAFNFCKNLDRL